MYQNQVKTSFEGHQVLRREQPKHNPVDDVKGVIDRISKQLEGMKNHIGGVQSRGRIVMTQHGFIPDDKRAIDKYKNQYKDHWLKLVGSIDFDLIEEGDLEETPITPNLLD